MKIALLGYGKMGKAIEKIALERGHEIVLKIGVDNLNDLTKENLEKADVAIEFSTPSTAYDNIQICFQSGVPVVVGTTGWLDKLPECIDYCENNKAGLFYASNFSVGVNVFFAINKKLAELMNKYDYSISMEEIHHTQKLDAPSGTAITLAEGIIAKHNKKSSWVNEPTANENELEIKSVREADVPGTHNITYSSDIDEIFIQHKAHNRTGFAFGAVLAAEFMVGKSGYYGMAELMGLDV